MSFIIYMHIYLIRSDESFIHRVITVLSPGWVILFIKHLNPDVVCTLRRSRIGRSRLIKDKD